MTRIAVILTGSPRFVNEGADWWFNRVAPPNCEIDYYGHCWNSVDPVGANRYLIPNQSIDASFFDQWQFSAFEMSTYTLNDPVYDSLHKGGGHVAHFMLQDFRRDHILSAAKANALLFQSGKEYDFVVQMRYDVVMRPETFQVLMDFAMNIEHRLYSAHKGMDRALLWIDDAPTIMCPWVQARQGLTVMGDYAFAANFKDWKVFASDLYQKYHDVLNRNLHLLEVADKVNFMYIPHILWAYVGLSTHTNFITGPGMDVCAIRSTKTDITTWTFDQLAADHDLAFDRVCDEYLAKGIRGTNRV